MAQIVTALDDEPLAVLRTLALRHQIARLRPLERDVLSLLHGLGCAPLPAARIAERLGISMRQVFRIHDRALQELGLLAVLEAAA
jgi:DNA-directed RNA polymerase specialized sigma subunit